MSDGTFSHVAANMMTINQSLLTSREDNCQNYLFICSDKGSSLKEKNRDLLPLGANSFLLELTHFWKGFSCAEKETDSHKMPLLYKIVENLPSESLLYSKTWVYKDVQYFSYFYSKT